MKKIVLLVCFLFFANISVAQPIKITPCEKISATTKYFMLGNTYNFKNVDTGEIYSGTVVFYRHNGFFGQEAQVEFNNFTDKNHNQIPGKITIIPSNHKNFQEFSNYSSIACTGYVRGSEVILKPNIHTFFINNTNEKFKGYVLTLKPNQEISTTHDETEISDEIEFINVEDVYKQGKLFVKANTLVYGIVDFVDENGWGADNAVIHLKKFVFKDVNGNKVVANAKLDISGFEILKYKSKRKKQFFNYFSTFVRGKEVDIKSYDENVIFKIVVE